MISHKILLVDPEAESARTLGFYLQSGGYQVLMSRETNSVLIQAREHVPSIILLGMALPNPKGFEICRQLRADPSTRHIPVIILSAPATEEDRILGFEAGADDFVTQPFSVREVILRIKKSLERTTVVPALPTPDKMALGALVLDSFRHEVTLHDDSVHLTPIEFRLLELLLKHLGGALDRRLILQEIWPDAKSLDSRTIDAHIKRLRGKLGPMGGMIETINGFGYRMNEKPVPLAGKIDRDQSKLNELVFAINRMKGGKPGLKKKLNALLAVK